MLSAYKTCVAHGVAKVLNRSLDLSTEGIYTAVRLHPFFKQHPRFVIENPTHLNDPTREELNAIQNELKYGYSDAQLQFIFRRSFISVKVDYDQFAENLFANNFFNTFNYVTPSKILVEFSSPNIAKSFHWGHLRSTIIGNFVANINKFAGHDVITMNYLGDWGMQVGFLKAGLEMCKYSLDDLGTSPIKTLQKAYVAANKENEMGPHVEERAKELFNQLEFSDPESEVVKQWEMYKQHTLEELKRIYKLFDIRFDHYAFESDYSAKKIQPLIEELKKNEVVVPEYDQSLVTWIDGQLVPFLKTDGSTLYITRDVAAALDRYKTFKFDKMYYVVDTMQRGHFISLIHILKKMQSECASKIEYIPFGRIHGMSTRQGSAVWLDDILNEARINMEKKQLESITRKVPLTDDVIDVLAKSSIIISDLKRNRTRHYNFDWNTALQTEGYCGVKLQYCHCRLHNLAENCGVTAAKLLDPKALQEPEAIALVITIARFEDALIDSYQRIEACFLVSYLFDLSDCVNKAFNVLKIKNGDQYIGEQRLLLFMKAKEVMNIGMKLLGMNPLEKM